MSSPEMPRISPVIRDFADYMEDYLDNLPGATPPIVRSAENIAAEKQLNRELRPWAYNHRDRYRSKGFGVLPILPSVFKDQQITQTGHDLTSLRTFFTEKRFRAIHRKIYDLFVGSPEVADKIIDGFDGIADYVVEQIKDREIETEDGRKTIPGNSVAVATGHLDNLADIGDFTDGLNLKIMEKHGDKYAERFKVIVNKLISQESIKRIPIAILASLAVQPRWGIPSIGAEKWGISEGPRNLVNGWLAKTFMEETKKAGEVWGIVAAGSAALITRDEKTNEITEIEIPLGTETAGFYVKCTGGVIVCNRLGDDIRISPPIHVEKPAGMSSKAYSRILLDKINHEIALQASELAGDVPVKYTAISGEGEPKQVTVVASRDRLAA